MANSLSDKHPEYSEVSQDWVLMRDAYKGERRVKSKGPVYLPYTASQILDGAGTDLESIGQKAYDAYKKRARFPNFMREAVQTAIGMMHSQPPLIKLPKAMENIRSSKGEKLPELLRRINVEQLVAGRVGLMADLPSNPETGKDMPYIALYTAERVINWDDGATNELVPQALNLVVIDESEYERSEHFAWKKNDKYRVLQLGELGPNESEAAYKQGVFDTHGYNPASMKAPSWRGTTLSKIPFVIINSCDITPDVDDPPLMDLGNMCMTIYRGDADYRQNLFMQGQDTFVTIGGAFDEDDKVRTGAGSRVDLPMGGDAKYVGVESSGLQEQREALKNLEARAGTMGAQLLDSTSRERESGDSLRIRVAARTADMNQIVETGASGLEAILKVIAEWMGENPDEVSVQANKDFGEQQLTGQTMVEMATARNLGFPISARSMHDVARKRRMTTMTFEEEIAAAEKETEKEDFVFKRAETGDRAGADQVKEGEDTGEEKSARAKQKAQREQTRGE